jgi:predicted dehydrogenase
MTQQPLRVGIIGVGMFASYFHVPQLRETGRAEIAAICRRSPERLAIASEHLGVTRTYTDWRAMLDHEQLDAVVISTPHAQHAEQSIAALEHGLHVLVDKPLALTGSEAWRVVEAARRADRVLMVCYASRAGQRLRALKNELDRGLIGRVRQISCATTTYRRWIWEDDEVPPDVMQVIREHTHLPDEFHADWQAWHRDPAQMGSGGVFPDLGVYSLDMLLWLADSAPVDVAGLTEKDGLPVECLISVQARLESGALLTLSFTDGPPQPVLAEQQQLMIVGERGTIMDDHDGSYWLYQGGERTPLSQEEPETTIAEAFVSTILDGRPNLSPGEHAANVVALMEAMYRSAAEGRVVTIEQGRLREYAGA